MKRDDDYIRELLFEAESSDDPHLVIAGYLDMKPEEIKRREHAKYLCDAGYFQETNRDVYRITNQGHDYINAIRDETVWNKTKKVAGQAGGASLSMLGDIASSIVKEKLRELGVPL